MSDTFRKTFRELTETEKENMKKIKEAAEFLEDLFNTVNTPDMGREISLAKTNLEQSVMWAVKGITK